MAYFNVLCKAGHLGRRFYMPIWFPVEAENGREAAKIARGYPRVKRDHKDAILQCVEIDLEGFNYQKEINRLDPYLRCKSRHEQNQIMPLIIDRIVPDNHRSRGGRQNYKKNRVNLFVQAKRLECLQDYYERIYDAEH